MSAREKLETREERRIELSKANDKKKKIVEDEIYKNRDASNTS